MCFHDDAGNLSQERFLIAERRHLHIILELHFQALEHHQLLQFTFSHVVIRCFHKIIILGLLFLIDEMFDLLESTSLELIHRRVQLSLFGRGFTID